MSEATERVVYEESTRTLRQQYELLDGLRGRAGTLLAAASVATAFLSVQALSRHQAVELIGGSRILHSELNAFAWSAIGLFCLVVVLTLVALIPWRWTFSHDPHLLIAVHLEPGPPSSIEELYRNLSYWNGRTTLRTEGSCSHARAQPPPPTKPDTGTHETRGPSSSSR